MIQKQNQSTIEMSQNIVPTNLAEEFAQEVVQEVQEVVQEEVMNPETDCPVCYMAMESRHVGDNCDHILCGTCFMRIIETTDKCPICREQLSSIQPHNIFQDNLQQDMIIQPNIIEQNIVQYENPYFNDFLIDTFDYDELIPGQREVIFEGDDVEPTIQLFNGRRWFDITTQQIRIYLNGRFLVEAEYRQTNEYFESERGIAIRQLSLNYDDFNTHQNCPFCGIQRTREANRYILQRFIRYYGNDDEFRINMNIGFMNMNYCWGTNAFDGQGLNSCLLCWISFRNLMHNIY